LQRKRTSISDVWSGMRRYLLRQKNSSGTFTEFSVSSLISYFDRLSAKAMVDSCWSK
jgi:hypothetical protein